MLGMRRNNPPLSYLTYLAQVKKQIQNAKIMHLISVYLKTKVYQVIYRRDVVTTGHVPDVVR